jgi:hypothetical protein
VIDTRCWRHPAACGTSFLRIRQGSGPAEIGLPARDRPRQRVPIARGTAGLVAPHTLANRPGSPPGLFFLRHRRGQAGAGRGLSSCRLSRCPPLARARQRQVFERRATGCMKITQWPEASTPRPSRSGSLRTVQELRQQAHERDELQSPLGIVLDQLVRPGVPEPRDSAGEEHHVAFLFIPVAVVG